MSTLTTARIQRVHFDPKNKKHVESLKKYISTGQWGDIKFATEGAYLNIPEYVMRKYIAHQLKCSDIAMAPIEVKLPVTEKTVEPTPLTNVKPFVKKVA